MWTPILFLLSKCSCLQKNKKYTRTAQLASNNRRGKKELAKFQHYSYLVPLLYTMAEGKLHRCNSRITTHFLIVARNISSSAPNSNCIASMRAIKAQHSRKRQYETTTKKAFCLIFQSDHGKRKSEMKKKEMAIMFCRRLFRESQTSLRQPGNLRPHFFCSLQSSTMATNGKGHRHKYAKL